jgi:hypothetical protein
VSQQLLQGHHIDARLQQVRRVAVPQGVNTLLISCPRRTSAIAITRSSISKSKSSGPFGYLCRA